MMPELSSIPEKKKILLPTAYLPPVHYFMLMATAEEVFIEQWETYPKQTYRNRCEIYSPNGKIPLIIPVTKPQGNHTMTKDIIVSEHENWQAMHWRAIRTAYANSPFFLYYRDELEPFFNERPEKLLEFNMRLLKTLLSVIGMEIEIRLTTQYIRTPHDMKDYRTVVSPKRKFNLFRQKNYYQTFEEKFGFIPRLSIIDLLFNLGPETLDYLTGAVERH